MGVDFLSQDIGMNKSQVRFVSIYMSAQFTVLFTCRGSFLETGAAAGKFKLYSYEI
jgi:hypothetical protein